MRSYLIIFSSFFISLFFFSQIKCDSIYNSTGENHTKINKRKNVFNFSTGSKARVDSNGSIYNSFGDYLGRFENYSNSYDSSGGFKGRIDSLFFNRTSDSHTAFLAN